MNNLYGGWENVSEYAVWFLRAALESDNLEELFMEQEREEVLSRDAVLQVQKYEEKKVKESNLNAIIQEARNKRK